MAGARSGSIASVHDERQEGSESPGAPSPDRIGSSLFGSDRVGISRPRHVSHAIVTRPGSIPLNLASPCLHISCVSIRIDSRRRSQPGGMMKAEPMWGSWWTPQWHGAFRWRSAPARAGGSGHEGNGVRHKADDGTASLIDFIRSSSERQGHQREADDATWTRNTEVHRPGKGSPSVFLAGFALNLRPSKIAGVSTGAERPPLRTGQSQAERSPGVIGSRIEYRTLGSVLGCYQESAPSSVVGCSGVHSGRGDTRRFASKSSSPAC